MERTLERAAGAVVLSLLAAGPGCRTLPYLTVSDSKSTFSLLGSPGEIIWTEAEPIAADAGIVNVPRFATNSLVGDTESARRSDGEQFWWSISHGSPTRTSAVAFPPGPWKEAETRLLSREVRNVFGSTVLDWSCNVSVWFSEDGESYLVELVGAGGGPEGYSIAFLWSYSHADRLLDIQVIEQLPGHAARGTRLYFRVTDELKLVPPAVARGGRGRRSFQRSTGSSAGGLAKPS